MKRASDPCRTGLGAVGVRVSLCIILSMELGLTGTEAVCCAAFVDPPDNIPWQLVRRKIVSQKQAHRGHTLSMAC
jgi:hypothetical protein